MRFVIAAAVWIAGASIASAQEQPSDPVPLPNDAAMSTPLLDFDRLEVGLRVGAVSFSSDFESHAQFGVGLIARAPSPWISRDLLGLDSEPFGLFMSVTASRINRDLDAEFDETAGEAIFVSAGLDFDLLRNDAWSAAAQAGIQYGYFGGVDETDSGVAALIGLNAGLSLASGLSLVVNPQAAFADSGDRVYFVYGGIHFEF